jgi:hypothetical protein
LHAIPGEGLDEPCASGLARGLLQNAMSGA